MPDNEQQTDRNIEMLDVDRQYLLAALSYVGILVFVPLLVGKDDPFVRFHIKQGLVLLAGVVLSLMAAAWWAAIGGLLFLVIMILDILALVQALLGRRWRVPVIGALADKFTI